MGTPARTRTSLYSRLQPARFSHPDRPLPKKENSAAPAAGSFAHGGKGTKTPFFRPLRLELPSGGQTLSGCPLSFRATGPWREKGRKHAPLLGSAWPVPCCSAGHGRWAAKNHSCNETPIPCVGAAFRRPPHLDQPLRLVATGALSWSSRTAFRKPPDQRQRRRTEGNPITARAGVAVQSPGSVPRRIFGSFLGEQKGTPPQQESIPHPTF